LVEDSGYGLSLCCFFDRQILIIIVTTSQNLHQRALMNPPCVLVFSGHDPCGGAGIQADIQSISAQGCHPLPLITCLTVQDTRNVSALMPVSVAQLQAQARTLLADIRPAAVKIGLLGSAEMVYAVAEIVRQLPPLPLVLDPVLAAGGGTALASAAVRAAMIATLLPLTTVLTPNSPEARALSDENDLTQAAARLCAWGCDSVLVTGAHEEGAIVRNTLYHAAGILQQKEWPRLPGEYHGSGCTLAAALAARLAQGETLADAAAQAQEYTWHSLARAFSPGHGQALPWRCA
jgi:hydroxymethylpyrimidine/phosphomethylpyrimidine kinase